MNALYIEGRRSGYSPDDCGKTLTVGELIEILSDFDEDLPVYLRNDNGYTYGNITERTIIPSEDLEEVTTTEAAQTNAVESKRQGGITYSLLDCPSGQGGSLPSNPGSRPIFRASQRMADSGLFSSR